MPAPNSESSPRIESSPASPGWWFRNRETGGITIAQAPNPPLWIFIAATVGRWLVPADGRLADVLWWVSTGALTWWAVDEVVRGVNPWRRLVGVAGVVFVVLRFVGR
ncbi:MAG: hypothetical protein R2704_06555 [Microthrixaceae bacterium]